jgi:hypothetical protein
LIGITIVIARLDRAIQRKKTFGFPLEFTPFCIPAFAGMTKGAGMTKSEILSRIKVAMHYYVK